MAEAWHWCAGDKMESEFYVFHTACGEDGVGGLYRLL